MRNLHDPGSTIPVDRAGRDGSRLQEDLQVMRPARRLGPGVPCRHPGAPLHPSRGGSRPEPSRRRISPSLRESVAFSQRSPAQASRRSRSTTACSFRSGLKRGGGFGYTPRAFADSPGQDPIHDDDSRAPLPGIGGGRPDPERGAGAGRRPGCPFGGSGHGRGPGAGARAPVRRGARLAAPADGRGPGLRGSGLPLRARRDRGIAPPARRGGAGGAARRGHRRPAHDAHRAAGACARAPGARARVLLQGRGQPRPPSLRARAGRGRAGRGQVQRAALSLADPGPPALDRVPGHVARAGHQHRRLLRRGDHLHRGARRGAALHPAPRRTCRPRGWASRCGRGPGTSIP